MKSAVLLAALVAGVDARVSEPTRSRDHTERMLMARGARIEVQDNVGHARRTVRAHGRSTPRSPAIRRRRRSSPRSRRSPTSGEIRLEHVCINETRIGFLALLRAMGARVVEENARLEGGEWVADIVVRAGRLARDRRSRPRDVPSMIDELPMLACLAARAEGETVITGAGELRVKESDRITAVVANLRAIGADAEELPDGMRVRGSARRCRDAS